MQKEFFWNSYIFSLFIHFNRTEINLFFQAIQSTFTVIPKVFLDAQSWRCISVLAHFALAQRMAQ